LFKTRFLTFGVVNLSRNALVILLRNQLITFAGLGWSILKDSTHKRSIIAEKENIIETLRLQQEGNQFSELIEMAKENSPQFWFRFHELYPEMYGKMIKINPNIKVPELTFCAYLYLGFSTKDIAEYTFVTVRAVETRKSRLREKYSIPSGIDFYNWIREL
ncbi:hypothetical protein HZQ57_03710, partial [Elizabethkingia anophelis]|nr:hypothetical protein [Elizabethkingia anophelis]MCT3811502.1 hypothetical protein [Elizabethkingia anophelis]MCT3818597.1 hypothetical protein [Elizabethkingia anophelis]